MNEKVVLQKPGEIPRKPGFYIERWFNGDEVPDARIVLMEFGDEPLPPTQLPFRRWKLLIEIKP